MDPIGATASIVALVELSLETFKIVKKITQHYRKAPKEILDFKRQIDGLRVQLILLRNVHISVSADELRLDSVELSIIDDFLLSSTSLISSIRDHFESQSLEVTKSRRLKWALSDAAKIKEWVNALERHSGILSSILALLDLRYSSLLQAEFYELKDHIGTVQVRKSQTNSTNWPRFRWTKNTVGAEWNVPFVARFSGSIYSADDDLGYTYGLSLRCYALFCLKALCLDLRIRRISLLTLKIFPVGYGIQIKNVVPDNSDIMSACRRGDTSAVWDLLHAGKARLNDITPNNFTPLRLAIQSGSTELVSFLINNGADIKGTWGLFQSTPLQAAFSYRKLSVARLLLARGAELYDLNSRGWTPSFNLFVTTSSQTPNWDSSLEYLQIVCAGSASTFEEQDGEGWSCMHRAAAFGNAEDIRNLISLHAPFTLRTKNLSWAPIFVAAQFGNMSTFNELKKHYPDLLSLADVRQWTLLHIAVNAKHIELIQLLVSMGADPHACSRATKFLVPDDLMEVSVKPGDIATLRGNEVFGTYVESLSAKGYTFEVTGNGFEEQNEIFWPSLEKIELELAVTG